MTGKSYSWGAAKSGQIYYLANLAQDVTGTGETATGGGGKGREGSKPPTLISTVAVVFRPEIWEQLMMFAFGGVSVIAPTLSTATPRGYVR